MGNKKIEIRVDYEEIKIKTKAFDEIKIIPFEGKILKTFWSLLDPFNLPSLITKAIRDTRFFLEDKYEAEREKLQHAFNLFVPIEFDHLTDRVLVRTKGFIDKVMNHYHRIELDLESISQFIKKLYPIRTIISENRHVLDVLKDF